MKGFYQCKMKKTYRNLHWWDLTLQLYIYEDTNANKNVIINNITVDFPKLFFVFILVLNLMINPIVSFFTEEKMNFTEKIKNKIQCNTIH